MHYALYLYPASGLPHQSPISGNLFRNVSTWLFESTDRLYYRFPQNGHPLIFAIQFLHVLSIQPLDTKKNLHRSVRIQSQRSAVVSGCVLIELQILMRRHRNTVQSIRHLLYHLLSDLTMSLSPNFVTNCVIFVTISPHHKKTFRYKL